VKFGADSFPNLLTNDTCDMIDGHIANKFQILVQITELDELPTHDGWKLIDYTSSISGHTVGNLIDPTDIEDVSMVVTKAMYDGATPYDIETFLGNVPNEPSNDPQFGDEQPFPGSVRLVRSTDIERMNFLINLPPTQFVTTQNPTHVSGMDKKITEIALLNSNKEVLVVAKTANPIKRSGTQVFGVKIDF
jgi:hypothetical protein